MSQGYLPGPPEEPAGPRADRSKRQHRGDHHRSQTEIPDIESCVRGIHQLAGLVVLGFLTSAQANSIRASFQEILKYHRHSEAREKQNALANGDLFDLARKNPGILSLLEPLLTDEQIEMLMADVAERDDG